MAETEKSEQPQTNGLENGLDEDERSKMRPADIDADVKEMERRKRVEMIMNSKLFREELERIIELQMKDGNGPAGLLQQISDMMGIQSGKLHTTHMFRGPNCLTPINDIRGVESMGYEKGEKNLRCKLASVFRLMDLYGWSQGINNQITARLNQDEEHFLVNPHGMLYNEITASSLVKVDMQGNVVEPGTTNFSVNTQGFLLHSAIHASRPDVNCVIHIKTPSVLAVSSLKSGLLPICQEALVIGEVSQHPFVSGIFEPEEREKIIRNLGPSNKVLLLHNHGAVCCGATVEEAFYNVYNTVLACETQMKLMPIGVENLLLVSDETRKQVYDAAHRAPDTGASGEKKKQFRVGEMEFEALIRMLDNAGFRTGYIYRHPLVKCELPKPKNDVEVPPAVSSLGYLIEQEELYKQGNWKKYIDGRNRLDRTKWLNSPNVYQKVEILETGTSDPKKITKWVDQNSEEWVAESSPTHSSTPVKIESALQFVPKGTNPKEFKKLQQQIKENRRADKITSGPQSHILEGVSWEDAKKLQDANITQTGDQVILVGAASKGIIQRNYQHNALVYKTPYAKNPFDSMSDKEIEDYKQLVERKQRGDTDYEESQSESEAISSSRQDALRHFKSPLLSPQSATSETEEESRDEPRVLRIETKTAPRPIQAEVVLSDAESDSTDARVERSHSARYPKAEKPESVTLMNSFRKSWSLKREKDKSKDVEYPDDESRNIHPSLILSDYERDRMESLHCCVARIKQLTYKPIIVDVGTKPLRPLLKSASDPSNLSTLNNDDPTQVDNCQSGVSMDVSTSSSCSNIVSDLRHRLNIRKKLIYSAKMKFLGFHKGGADTPNGDAEIQEKAPTSPMCALISEIKKTINEIMSPERNETSQDASDEYFNSMRWIERPKFVPRTVESDVNLNKKSNELKSRVSLSKSFSSLTENNSDSVEEERSVLLESLNDFQKDFQMLPVESIDLNEGDRSCTCGETTEGVASEDTKTKPKVDENQNVEIPTDKVVTEVVKFVNVSDDEATYTVADDSLLQTYSFTETTETEWYYNKTILNLENSQTVLEIKEIENKEMENQEVPMVKYIDTGIDTDFTSEKETDVRQEKQKESGELEVTEDIDADAPLCESSGLNKSSETDSSFLKSSSGRTSNDVDTSFAFKTETETSEKTNDKNESQEKDSSKEETNKLNGIMKRTREPIEEESSDSGAPNHNGSMTGDSEEPSKRQSETCHSKLPGIPESPEYTNVDTEDAPITSSSKDTSPEIEGNARQVTEDEPLDTTREPVINVEKEKENLKPDHKRKKNVKSSTKITVKKEMKEKNSDEPIVSEIKLTIKNLNPCQSEKYEVKIQDVTNTSEELSRSVSSTGENVETFESFEIVENDCDCDAQQNLEDLQGEVSSTIEKLQTIENYFEDEIKKHSIRKSSDEFTFEYNYRELEEVLNESKDEVLRIEAQVVEERGDDPKSGFGEENAEYFMSYLLDNICGEVEICDDAREEKIVNPIVEEKEINKDSDESLIGSFMYDGILNLALNLVLEDEKQINAENVNASEVSIKEEVVHCNDRENTLSVVNASEVVCKEELSREGDRTNGPQISMIELLPFSNEENTKNTSQIDALPQEDGANAIDDEKEAAKEVVGDVFEKRDTELCNIGEECHRENVPTVSEEETLPDARVKIELASDNVPEHEGNLPEEGGIFKEVIKVAEPVNASETSSDIDQQPTDSGIENPTGEDHLYQRKNDEDICEEETSVTGIESQHGTRIESRTEEIPEDVKREIIVPEESSQCENEDNITAKEESTVETTNTAQELEPVLLQTSENFADVPVEETQELLEQICMVALSVDLALNCQLDQGLDKNSGSEQNFEVEQLRIEDIEVITDIFGDFGSKNSDEEPNVDVGEPILESEVVIEEMTVGNTTWEKSDVLFWKRLFKKLSNPLKAITWKPVKETDSEDIQETQESSQEKVDSNPVEYILNFLINSAMNEKVEQVPNEESPTNSLNEFEVMENIISTSNSIIADIIDSLESQMEGDVESLPDEEETQDWDTSKSDKKLQKKGESIFKVTIATPRKKEIFINYSMDFSSSFNISEMADELCNSYIKTDDVNEDFENLSSDNPDFFSLGSPDKNSPNSSFCSTSSALECHGPVDQYCCVNCETNRKSPRSLAIIQEVDEGDSSVSSEPVAPSNS